MMLDSRRTFSKGLNSLLVLLQKKDWRGKHKFYTWLANHFAHKVIIHKVDNREFCVPVGEWCFWLDCGPENYYLDEFLPFCGVLNDLNEPFTFFDLGADIGSVSSLVATHCQNLKNIVAFEPNSKSFEVLTSNLNNFNEPSHCINVAISDFEGLAAFHAAQDRLNDHEGYIDSNVKGDTPVTSLDVWITSQQSDNIENTVVLKVDVEGHEIQALRGAVRLINQAAKVVILIEIHPEVLSRTHNTPEDLFSTAEMIRHFDWLVPLHQNKPIDRNQPFFEQMPIGQYDIIGVSK
jgi:FkbM family methyltransferase